MNLIKLLPVALIVFQLISLPIVAQQSSKSLKKEIKSKAVKEARKEAKRYKKQGYYVAPGALPMEKQIEKAWIRQYETDDTGFPLYIVATGNSVAGTQSAAKLQATELAKLELAGSISTQVAALIENNIANQQFNSEEAETVQKTVGAAKNIIAQELGRTIPLFEIYRKVGKNVEAELRVAYNSEMAKELARRSITKKLEEETEIVQDKLEKLMNF